MKYLGTVETLCISWGVCVDSIPNEVLEVKVYRNGRLKVAFGKAKRETKRSTNTVRYWIELNKKLWNDRNELIDTFTHEIAHIVADVKHGEWGHGWCWQHAHHALGGSGQPKAQIASAAKLGIERARKLIGICEKCEHQFYGPQRLKKNRRYTHRSKCGGRVVRIDL